MSESEKYCRVNPYADPKPKLPWDESYDMLRGPDGFECLLTEPENRTWWRDGKNAVARLNEQHAEIERLTAENKRLLQELDEAEARAAKLEQKEAAREKRFRMERFN